MMMIMVIMVNDLMMIIIMTNHVDDHDMILPGRPAQHHTRERNPPVQGTRSDSTQRGLSLGKPICSPQVEMKLTILSAGPDNFGKFPYHHHRSPYMILSTGKYSCVAKNPRGQTDGSITLYGGSKLSPIK